MTERGSRTTDPNGNPLLLGDSQTAVHTFGLNGSRFLSSPKNKFLFFAKFHRPNAEGGSDWLRGVSFALKAIDRPKISFETQTLNQYNRKRVVQSYHNFESLALRFHDTVDEALNRMFLEYYAYYYGDPINHSAGMDVNDVVKANMERIGTWGFRPQPDPEDLGLFFSHISIYQLYQGKVSRFDLINPKLVSYDPDNFDYSEGQVVNEIQIQIAFEGITYEIDGELTPELAADMGLDYARYFELENDLPPGINPGLSLEGNIPDFPVEDQIERILRGELTNLITTGRTNDLGTIGANIFRTFDPTRGVASGRLGGAAVLGNILNGNVRGSVRTLGAQLKGALRGRPRGFF